ncbi:hypothetical protein FOZ63_012661, partial [Perkinsus olseni]
FKGAKALLCCEERLNIIHPAVPPCDVFAQDFVDKYASGDNARFRIRELPSPGDVSKYLQLTGEAPGSLLRHCKSVSLMASPSEEDRGFFAGRDKDGSWRCTLCDITVCYEGIFLSHMQGEKHAKNVRNLQWGEHERRRRRAGQEFPRASPVVDVGTPSTYESHAAECRDTQVEAAGEPMWKKDSQYNGFRDFSEQCSEQFYPDGRTLAGCGVIPPLDERPPNTWGE